ncbi:MAG TPA: SUMF1/EgtB/PvdO family nonheme iron enzyme [Candidatus Angelobacter sp.]
MHRLAAVVVALAVVLAVAQNAENGTKRNSKDGLLYASIPAGGFQMGCAREDCPPNERPVHKVTISQQFWIGTTEVTVAAYKRFSQATNRLMPPDAVENFTVNPGWKDEQSPIVNVTWNDAAAYCKWAGGALPTEAQWEYAARGGSSSDPYGPLNDIAWTASNSGREHLDADALFRDDKMHYEQTLRNNGNKPHQVAQKRANGFGLYDMIGNVAEWTNDWVDLSYYSHSPENDPAGPSTGQAKIARGGHFLYPNAPNRASKRLWNEPEGKSPIIGFRCVLTVVHP